MMLLLQYLNWNNHEKTKKKKKKILLFFILFKFLFHSQSLFLFEKQNVFKDKKKLYKWKWTSCNKYKNKAKLFKIIFQRKVRIINHRKKKKLIVIIENVQKEWMREGVRASCKCLFVNDEWYLTGSSSMSIIDMPFSDCSFSRIDWTYQNKIRIYCFFNTYWLTDIGEFKLSWFIVYGMCMLIDFIQN